MLELTIAALGGGGIVGLVSLLLKYRAENNRMNAEGGKLTAEGGKLTAEADSVTQDTVQRRYDSLFDDFETELTRLRHRVDEAETREASCNEKLYAANVLIGSLRVEAAHATADVKLARAEIVTLQDRLDRLEAR